MLMESYEYQPHALPIDQQYSLIRNTNGVTETAILQKYVRTIRCALEDRQTDEDNPPLLEYEQVVALAKILGLDQQPDDMADEMLKDKAELIVAMESGLPFAFKEIFIKREIDGAQRHFLAMFKVQKDGQELPCSRLILNEPASDRPRYPFTDEDIKQVKVLLLLQIQSGLNLNEYLS